jgi:hypothetical protein
MKRRYSRIVAPASTATSEDVLLETIADDRQTDALTCELCNNRRDIGGDASKGCGLFANAALADTADCRHVHPTS